MIFLEEILKTLSNYATAITALATFFLVLVTLLLVATNFFLVRGNRLQRQVSTNPEMVAYLLPSERYPNILNLIIANIGQGPARIVNFSFDADKDDFSQHNVEVPFDTSHNIFTLIPAGEKITAFFGMAPELLKDDPLKPFTVVVEYETLAGKKRSGKFPIDIRQFLGLVTVGRPPEHEIAQSLKKISDHLGKWTSGISRLKVETVTREAETQQIHDLIEEVQGETRPDPTEGDTQ